MTLRTARFGWALALMAVAGCRCDGDGVGSTTAGFHTDVRLLDFGKTLEGVEVTRQLRLQGTGRAEVTVSSSTEGPFRAPVSVRVPGGGEAVLGVTFTAPEGDAEGILRLEARDEAFEVVLRGRGVRPLDCVASAPCRVVRFDLEQERCVESPAEEGSACTPANLCLENGQCRGASCVGTPRACDDGNACTRDACSPQVGCVNTDSSHECPPPPNPCEAAVCLPASGCAVAMVEDGTLCGPVSCVTVSLCSSGVCTQVPAPDGLVCAPPTPCQGEGRCAAGDCLRPDAGDLVPAWSVPLGQAPGDSQRQAARLRSQNGNVFFGACGLQSRDGGCALVSYTANGFLRFDAPLHGEAPQLQGVAPWGALVSDGTSLAAYLPTTGALLWSLPLTGLPFTPDGGTAVLPPGAVALAPDGGAWLSASFAHEVEVPVDAGEADAGEADAGVELIRVPQPRGVALVHLEPDGGLQRAVLLEDAGFGSRIALTQPGGGALWLHADGGPLLRALPQDGGFLVLTLGDFTGGSLSAVAGGEGAAVGGRLVAFADGGVRPLADLDGGEDPVDYEALFDGQSAYAFFRACRPPDPLACLPEAHSTVLRSVNLEQPGSTWEARILPGHVEGRLVEAALGAGALTGGVLTLTEATLDAGPRTDLQLFFPAGRALLCPLQGAPQLEGALFEQGVLFALVSRNGQLRLEAYNLAGFALLQSGWPRSGGAGGGRREE